MKKTLWIIISALSVLFAVQGCCKSGPLGPDDKYDRVLIIVSAGYNNLKSFLRNDISEMCDIGKGAYVPSDRSAQAIVVISHEPEGYDYGTPTPTYLFRIYKNSRNGEVVMDTLDIFDEGKKLTEPSLLAATLCKAVDRFPSDHYSMVYSSHGTGWLPEGFYGKYGNSYSFAPSRTQGSLYGNAPVRDNPTGTIGNEFGNDKNIEMDIKDFARCIPMHLENLFLDACLMGCVEVAYELRHNTDRIGLSATEILTEGFNYTTLARNILVDDNPTKVCRDYFETYDKMSGDERSATIALIDCTKLEALSSACRTCFEQNRSAIDNVRPAAVQGFFRYGQHWFYDLEDILVQSIVSPSDLESVRKALRECVLYKASTPGFIGDFDISTFCGLSMYLPSNGHTELESFYKELAWNKATGLLK